MGFKVHPNFALPADRGSMKIENAQRFYTTQQACRVLNLGRTFLHYCREAGLLQYTRIGIRGVRYTDEQLDEFKQLLVERPENVRKAIQQLTRVQKRRH